MTKKTNLRGIKRDGVFSLNLSFFDYSPPHLGECYLQPANQARLCGMLQTQLLSPAKWSQQPRSALNPSSLADECDVYSLALLFDVSFQILSSTTSVQVINIQGTRGMTIGHVNSSWVKHFVGT